MSGLKEQMAKQQAKKKQQATGVAEPSTTLSSTFTHIKPKRLVIDVQPDLHQRMKELAAQRGTTIKELVVAALENTYNV